jgi:hypothetical protein
MKKPSAVNREFGSTYNLLVRSEEKGRGLLETAVYTACVVSVLFTISQFAQAPLTSVPTPKPCVACQAIKSDVRART